MGARAYLPLIIRAEALHTLPKRAHRKMARPAAFASAFQLGWVYYMT